MISRRMLGTIVISAAAFAGILSYEAFRSDAYDDGVGVHTIGFGTTHGVRPGDTITVEKAIERALSDVTKFEGAIKRCVKVPLSQNEYDAYVSLAYNIGTTAFCNSTLVKKLNNLEYREACDQILRWTKAGGKTLQGLVKRRQQEHALCIMTS